jgi:hypothetical protein
MRRVAHFHSVCALLGCIGSGCISQPPTYEDTQKIPPFILLEKTDPPPWVFRQLVIGEDGEYPAVPFTVRYYSEDLGDPVQALVYVDSLPGDSRQEQEGKTVDATEATAPESILRGAAGTFGEERTISFTITDFRPGCHAVSALLTHASNFEGSRILSKDQVARVVWWFDVQGNEDPVLVSDCPTLGIEPPQDL